MKRVTLLLMIFTGLMLGSCTHNDGDIGKWFGTWAVQSISVDGVPADDYHGDILWKFQSDVFSMLRFSTDPVDHSYQQVWGSWREDGDALVLRFGYSDDSYAPGTGIYAPFAETLIAPQGESVLTITSKHGNDVSLLYVTPSGERVEYTIHKQ